MKVLVTFGSRYGGTKEIATTLGDVLAHSGHQVEVLSAHESHHLKNWDAVIVGGGLYAGRFHKDARRFIHRHLDELVERPVWLFSSGPLDDSAHQKEILPTRQVQRLLDLTEARGHKTFGGRLDETAKGFIAKSIVRQGKGGDFRNMEDVKTWGHQISSELQTIPPSAQAARRTNQRPVRIFLSALCLFTGLTALLGSIGLLGHIQGSPPTTPPLSVLQHTPFQTFLWPGVFLLLVSFLHLLAGVFVVRRYRKNEVIAFTAGCSISIWIVTQMAMLRSFNWLQGVYAGVGLATLIAALWLYGKRRKHPNRGSSSN